MPWTSEQVTALAPDASSAKSGRDLASARKWSTLGTDGTCAWGTILGSGKSPYQASIDLSEPAFKCSCPSRKFPCKNGLGLFLILAEQPGAFTEHSPPAWTSEWLAQREESAVKRMESAVKRMESAVKREEKAARPRASRRFLSPRSPARPPPRRGTGRAPRQGRGRGP